MAQGSSVIRQFVRKYGVVIFLPTFTASTIFADWSHTQRWKRSLKDKHHLIGKEIK